jgi:hypothetical protein
VGELEDFVQYLDDHRDDASRLIVTLAALVLIVLALLLIIVELAPEEETRELRVEQAGATTIVPAEPLRLRLEEALTGIAQVTAAKARVFSHDKGIGMKLHLTVTPDTNIALVTQDASRVVVETLQADLGLPISAPPEVHIIFGPPRTAPLASSMTQPPTPEPPAAPPADEPTAEPAEPTPEAATPEGERPSETPPPAPDAEGPPQDESQQH